VISTASNFLHCQLKEAVWKHPHILKNSLDLILIVEMLLFDAAEQIMLAVAGVNLLHPSLVGDLECGMEHISFNGTLKSLCLKLVQTALRIHKKLLCFQGAGMRYTIR
jgi:hypothetical protein